MNPIAIPTALTLLFGGSFVVNEWSHGGMSESLGLGHHHAFDYGGYHCAAHNDTRYGQDHADHMHVNGSVIPHSGCEGGAGMHQGPMGGGA